MTRRARAVVAFSLLVTFGAVLTGCGDDDTEVRAIISRRHVDLDPPRTAPGRTAIVAVNRDTVAHDLHVVRLSEPAPIRADHAEGGHGDDEGVPSAANLVRDSRGAVFESEIPTEALTGAISRVAPGASARIEVTLRRGRYAIFCNLVRTGPDGAVESDFAAGEHAELRVR